MISFAVRVSLPLQFFILLLEAQVGRFCVVNVCLRLGQSLFDRNQLAVLDLYGELRLLQICIQLAARLIALLEFTAIKFLFLLFFELITVSLQRLALTPKARCLLPQHLLLSLECLAFVGPVSKFSLQPVGFKDLLRQLAVKSEELNFGFAGVFGSDFEGLRELCKLCFFLLQGGASCSNVVGL